MASLRFYTVALAALAPGALARLMINNWCGNSVSIVKSHAASCDFGQDGKCISDGGRPWVIPPGSGNSILGLDYIADGVGASVKIAKDGGPAGVLQFEYNVVNGGNYGGLYWDLSDLDGSGPGLVGTPFFHDNVKVTPTGKGSGTGTCVIIRCTAGQVCLDSYQHPDDPNTKHCPVDTGDLWLDLCMPRDLFDARRAVADSGSAEENNTEEATPQHDRRHEHLGAHLTGHKRHFRA
ncbi:hypothetical protein ACRE_006710 [Hapsidospora chrysogenum ATCC 11550]|uniref:Antigenic thaumatin-like protein n=1 Tax=Hapsidospora chrysogenum (strain ATCC 11550 / CBS 779.69 / DSM 880 / IAM 14645 / JCM 23072 / IMI 49137) TaxID=857340 RepID=A0A086TGE0_HAPC1|nr:hypothetical protein ACRE_006710 [Hapsidospora chrysogenum ATCC 11550]